MYVCMYVSLVPRPRGRPGYEASMYVCMFVVCMHVSSYPGRMGGLGTRLVCMYVCMLASYPGHVGGLGTRLVCMYVCMYVSLVPRPHGRPGYEASMYVCMYVC